jgi:heptosyltransferase-2
VRVAVIKPDHLGDLILSSPVIKAIAARYPDTTVFVASRTRPLAEYLFPDLCILTLDLPHLQKFGKITPNGAPALTSLLDFDLVYFLRNDQVLTPGWAKLVANHAVIIKDRPDVHETQLQAEAVRSSGVQVDVPDTFPGVKPFPKEPRRIGLCISAGFYANRWITMRWVELARLLRERGVEIVVVGGPAETDEARTICRLLKLDPEQSVITGSSDFPDFLGKIRELDLIVATDGGTAHICSLAAPVLSLFGGSPFQRFAPFGRHNRLVTRLLPCSPCCQYHESVLNLCVTTECVTQILAASVVHAIHAPQEPAGTHRKIPGEPPVTLFFGVSHSRIPRGAVLSS